MACNCCGSATSTARDASLDLFSIGVGDFRGREARRSCWGAYRLLLGLISAIVAGLFLATLVCRLGEAALVHGGAVEKQPGAREP